MILNQTYLSTCNTLKLDKFIFKAPNTTYITKRNKKKIELINNTPIFQTPSAIKYNNSDRASFIPGEKKLNFDNENINSSNIKRSLRSTSSKTSIASIQSDVTVSSITSTLENKLSMIRYLLYF